VQQAKQLVAIRRPLRGQIIGFRNIIRQIVQFDPLFHRELNQLELATATADSDRPAATGIAAHPAPTPCKNLRREHSELDIVDFLMWQQRPGIRTARPQ
jgi:hypothetical protein